MSDLQEHLLALRSAGEGVQFEADFVMGGTSLGGQRIALDSARDHLIRGLVAIDAARACLRADTTTTTGEPE